jgi:hypothetical protein
MAEFKIDRFKYNWKGEWQATTDYIRDDIVRVNGRTYVCIKSHTSQGIFADDLNAVIPGSNPPVPDTRWIVMTVSKSFVGTWSAGTSYVKGDLVLFDGTVWACVDAHGATNFATDLDKWEVFTKTIAFIGDWQENETYGHGAIVKYNGIVYKCLTSHTAGATLELNINDWEEFHTAYEYRNQWLPLTNYRKNDLVRYGGTIFRCIETHTSGPAALTEEFFVIEYPGTQFDGNWDSGAIYNIGDIVRYGGFLYYAINNNFDSQPSEIYAGYSGADSTNDWLALAKTYNFVGDWQLRGVYRTGDIVTRGGNLYLAKRDVNESDGDESSLTYLDPDVWELLIPGKKFIGPWDVNHYYSIGEVVYHLGTAYVCSLEHTSTAENFPGDNGSGYDYWDVLIQAGQPGGLHDRGDLLTYGLNRTSAGDGSSLGDTRLPIGKVGQVLSTSEDLEAFWRNFANAGTVIYVNDKGINRPGRGFTREESFRTIRYACEYVEDNFPPLSPVTISVSTGRYYEAGPISIPAGTVVYGDELRATTIVATPPVQTYVDNFSVVKDYITYIETFIFNIVTNNVVEPLDGNSETQTITTLNGSADAANRAAELFVDWKNYVDFYVVSGDTNPTMTGSNTPNADVAFFHAANNIRNNIRFISGQVYANLVSQGIDLDKDDVYEDVNSLMRGIARDVEFSGNYGTIMSARRYSNLANGAQNDDLFWVRDTTGIRNTTMKGLVGTLNPPGVFDLYQRPTGGAYVALDPGWGPDDERVWISNRSPYLQGNTNIGGACVGAKIDGALHNGGNKSMTANDFTQILSDGIGAWITNGARAELISVFTYYCAIGYFAEDGGIIRSANGNNSYGQFGTIADGNDPTEVPDACTVMNRNNTPVIDTAFSGGPLDTISLFEYENAGSHYTYASATLRGAGAGANVEFDDFRDGAIFNARLVNTKGSGSEGGSNYTVKQGNAQETADSTSSLILAAADDTQFLSEIEGMRIIIIQGDGYGQYGYISDYNVVNQTVTVRKESDDTLGWDHMIPGTPINTSLDSTARYRIEPRITCSAPGFSSTSHNLTSGRTFLGSDFGGLTQTYTGILAQVGTGETFGLEPIPAVLTVVRSGSIYNVTITNSGAGYAAGDTITIAGTALGGATPDNDLILTITEVTDDSTSSIVSFDQKGTGRLGRFVALADPNFIVYSDDGENWSESNLDALLDYNSIIAQNNRFIAIGADTNQYNFSYDGVNWTTRSLPATETWNSIAGGPGGFVVIAENATNFAYSSNGLTWQSSGTVSGSAIAWKHVAYGQGKFVAIADDRSVSISQNNGATWTTTANAIPAGTWDFVSLTYGGNRFFAITSDGLCVYSVDGGNTWYQGTNIPDNGANTLDYIECKYAQGIFMVISQDAGAATSLCATTEDGLIWTQNSLNASQVWSTITFGSLNGDPKWVLLSNDANTNAVINAKTGARAKLRSDVFTGTWQRVKIWDPGSGYTDGNSITVTVTDPNFVTEVEIDLRVDNGVLAQPSFISRGAGYRSSTTTVAVSGDGYADIIPEASILVVEGVNSVPGPGVQIRIDGILDLFTEDPDDLKLFNGVKITDLGDDGSGNGTRLVQFQISPKIENEDNLEHGTAVTLRSQYSQARVTFHDYLDIGTGNFEETNYPELYAGGGYFLAAPENEVYEANGGRVFYTSTDQAGNFRGGELFSVEQATGIVTISAEFFDLDGLSELALGGVRLGGSGAVVRDFSTDPTFAEDSNNVVPTQRAIATFLADRLSVGGEDLETNRLIAGRVSVGGEENEFTLTVDGTLDINTGVNLSGVDKTGKPVGISGSILAQMMYFRQFNDTVQ